MKILPAPRIELVYHDGCGNVDAARRALGAALEAAGLSEGWTEWRAGSAAAPERVRGLPSPTVLVGGEDVQGPTTGGAAACRVSLERLEEHIVRALRHSGRR